MKKIIMGISAAVMAHFLSLPAFAGTWKQDEKGWWFQNDDKSYPAGAWVPIKDHMYYFLPDGYMATGWVKIENNWYYFGNSGAKRTFDLQTDVFYFQIGTDGICTNFYANTTPSQEAGWALFDPAVMGDFSKEMSAGHIILYKDAYWITPDQANALRFAMARSHLSTAPKEITSYSSPSLSEVVLKGPGAKK